MFEIEIKAWAHNREEIINSLNSFAQYVCSIEKEDVYYRFPSNGQKKGITFRIRKEKIRKNGEFSEINLFTYKKKEKRFSSDGSCIEVNSENEFSFDNPEALLIMTSDLGAEVYLRKKKIVECWYLTTEYGTANIELCTVPPLGDFLEIEIVTDQENNDIVQKIKSAEEKILSDCGIPLSDIEPKFYSELFKEKEVIC